MKAVPRPNSILDGASDRRTDPKHNHNIGFIPFAYHLVPLEGLARVAAVMRKGERKNRNGWEQVPVEEHINHAISHLIAYLRGRHAEHHLANAGCRVLMALDLDRKEVLPRPSPSMLSRNEGEEDFISRGKLPEQVEQTVGEETDLLSLQRKKQREEVEKAWKRQGKMEWCEPDDGDQE